MVDSLIRLYSPTETEFETNGLGVLVDATSAIVTEERNGSYELALKYPITGRHFEDITYRSLIFCKPNPFEDPQPFRVYSVSKPINGVVTFTAQHISYDLSDMPVEPFTAAGISETMAALKSYSLYDHPFTFWTNLTGSTEVTIEEPKSIRAVLGDGDGCILDIFNGEYKFDRYAVQLYQSRGSDRGFSIRYGKNLTDLTQDENCERIYSGIYPYWKSADGNLVTLSEKVMSIASTDGAGYYSVLIADFSSEFRDEPTEEELREFTKSYVEDNNLGTPEVNLTVSFTSLRQAGEYELISSLEKLLLCDTLTVEFPKLNVSTTAKCISTEYDVLKNRYESIQLGDVKSNLARTVAMQQRTIETVPTQTIMWKAIDHGTALITGNKGGYAVLHDSDGDKYPDELLFMDQPTIDTAVNVLRINKSGIGFSANGYDGPYHTAWTLDGHFYADFIDSGTLTVGGASAESPVLRILNTSGTEIGRWDTSGIKATVGTFNSVTVAGSTISGSTLTNSTGGTYVGTCSGSNLNSCSTNGTKLTVANGSISGSSNFAIFSAGVGIQINGGGTAVVDLAYGKVGFTYGDVFINNDLDVSGSKNRVVKTENYGQRCLSAFETPMPTFSDFGEAILDANGVCYITIDPIFAETVMPDYRPIIFLTKYGQGDVWVDDENTMHDILVIRGTPGLKFSWEARYQQKAIHPERLKIADFDRPETVDPDFNLEASLEQSGAVDYGTIGCDYYENFEMGVFS